jgi:hypothetical protein
VLLRRGFFPRSFRALRERGKRIEREEREEEEQLVRSLLVVTVIAAINILKHYMFLENCTRLVRWD